MRKLIFVILLLASIMISCAGCASSYDLPEQTAIVSSLEWYGMSPPVQPEIFDGLDEAKMFLTERNYGDFIEGRLDELEVKAYDYMVDMIQSKGYLRVLSCYAPEDEIVLFPNVQYEDVGVRTVCNCGKEDNYHCYFYYIDEELAEKSPTIKEYCLMRFGSQYWEDTKFREMKVADQKILVAIKTSDTGLSDCRFLLDGFYVRIRYRDNLSSILKNLSFKDLPIE